MAQEIQNTLRKDIVRFLDLHAVVERTTLNKTTIYGLMAKGQFPKQRSITGSRSVRWLESEVDDWCAEKVNC